MVLTDRALERERMVERQLRARGVESQRVLDAFREVPREAFVEPGLEEFAYTDAPLPIGESQTISQPYVVALMVEALEIRPGDRVLEVGAGSGYAAAILSRLASEVYAIERHGSLAREAQERIERLGYDNVEIRSGDGTLGWPEAAPFDAILVSAGGPDVPPALLEQLAPGGRIVIPVGTSREQELIRITKSADGRLRKENLGPVMFVPLIGHGGWKDSAAPATAATATAPAAPAIRRRVGVPELIAEAADTIGSIERGEIEPLLGRIGDATLVLMGEASHGTSEFYRMRARITRELVQAGRIGFVALEADWPDAARIDRYVRQIERSGKAEEANAFARFPTWMWRNEEVLAFVDWLRTWNREREPAERVAVHGLDLYSLRESIARVVGYLDEIDPEIARVARSRYACLTPYQSDPAMYGMAAMTEGYRQCEDGVVRMLSELLERRLEYLAAEVDGERFFDAVQNARVVANAERYYREMYRSGAVSWNLRDEHMFETLTRILEVRGTGPKGAGEGAEGAIAEGAVWAHNSHLGDASATEMAVSGELNVGQLVRERFGEAAYTIGFGTHAGTVAAAHEWDGEVQVMDVRPSRPDSYEHAFHDSGARAATLGLRDPRPGEVRTQLMEPRLERAIGVIYRPETELMSHYFQARLPLQFDEYVWFDETSAVRPLGRPGRVEAEGHPFATLDR
jgi:protein-L-isoaspartate(D-aspartate) O-methyltransferase